MHQLNPLPKPSVATCCAKAMILAAGRGKRMQALTDHCPKPMLKVRGQALIEWHIQALARQGYTQLVCNTAWLGDQIEQGLQPCAALGDGASQTHITYSREGVDFGYALETAGGIIRALPLLDEVFWIVAGDVFAPEFSFDRLAYQTFASSDKLAHLWLVPNPEHNRAGDFGLSTNGLALNLATDSQEPKWTYSTIGLYKKQFFEASLTGIPTGNPAGVPATLAPLLRAAMDSQQVSAQIYAGSWTDVGTPQRLRELNT